MLSNLIRSSALKQQQRISAALLSTACTNVGINQLGITGPEVIHRNLSYPELFEHEKRNKEGVVAKAEYGDTFTADTGLFTGDSKGQVDREEYRERIRCILVVAASSYDLMSKMIPTKRQSHTSTTR